MPTSIQIGFLVLGAFLLLIGILGGNFKLFGGEVAAKISNPYLRFVSSIIGIAVLIAAAQSPPPVSEACSAPTTTSGYNSNEHPFCHMDRIKSLTQEDGNSICRTKFAQLKATGDLGGGFDPNSVVHIWAHQKNGDCIANTN